ncbi:MAG: hypothetical protein GX417_06915 [Clostridiales bacterium]|nr:hypothetical protein [Clostridiales bacterium]
MKNVLWTGGWDSTFRVLELAIIKKEVVQPHYILDNERASTPQELQAMEQIKELMIRKFPYTKDLILDHRFMNKNDIPPNETISQDFDKLLSMSHLGAQYEWLGRYADSNGLNDLELCIENGGGLASIIHSSVKKIDDNNDSYYVLALENLPYPEMKIFQYYHFPVFELSKLQMGELAAEYDFRDIMEHTWFCHNPRKNGSPCGMCTPCKLTRKEGLGRRVPNPALSQLLGHYYKSIVRRIKKLKTASRRPHAV